MPRSKLQKQKSKSAFFFACQPCWNLDPQLVVILNNSTSKCSLCSDEDKKRVFLCQTSPPNRQTTTPFVKYEVIRFKKKTSRPELCRQFQDGNCEDGNSCCYAHSENEAFVWDGNVGLWELSHHSMRNRMSGNEPVFYCSWCFLSFEGGMSYNLHLQHDFHVNVEKDALHEKPWVHWDKEAQEMLTMLSDNITRDMFANQLFDKYSLENKDDFSDFLEDVTELTVQNYVENTHMFLYQEERKRQEILSRWSIAARSGHLSGMLFVFEGFIIIILPRLLLKI